MFQVPKKHIVCANEVLADKTAKRQTSTAIYAPTLCMFLAANA